MSIICQRVSKSVSGMLQYCFSIELVNGFLGIEWFVEAHKDESWYQSWNNIGNKYQSNLDLYSN